jgi:hypothetical protein
MVVLEAPTINVADQLKLFRLGLKFLDTKERFGRAKEVIRHINSEINQGY